MSYLPIDPNTWYLRNVVVGSRRAAEIAMAPQGTPTWHEARLYRLSGSRVGQVFNHGFMEQTDPNKVVEPFLWPQPLNSPWVAWGSKHEIDAQRICEERLRARFGDEFTLSFEYPGGIVIRTEEWFIASVDGIVALHDPATNEVVERILLEFKCPKRIYPAIKPEYVDQTQAYMGFLRIHDPDKYGTMNRCIFGQWTPEETKFDEFARNEAYFEQLRATAKRFYTQELLPRYVLKATGYLKPPPRNNQDDNESTRLLSRKRSAGNAGAGPVAKRAMFGSMSLVIHGK